MRAPASLLDIDDATDLSTTWSGASVAASGSNPLGFSYDGVNDETTINAIPEPATMVLLALGGLAVVRRRR